MIFDKEKEGLMPEEFTETIFNPKATPILGFKVSKELANELNNNSNSAKATSDTCVCDGRCSGCDGKS